MRLAVTGKTGQVVTALLERGEAMGAEIVALGRPEIDLSLDRSVLDTLAAASPDVIVSAAAYTAVDKAETEADRAEAVNARGPGLVAEAAAALNVPVIHLSTDYVFDGSKPSPYVETDATRPLGVYGRTKLAGETAVAAATPNHVILRTAWVYSPFGQNFLKTMLRLAADRPELRVVDDQRGNPTSALDIADAVLVIARNLFDRPDDAALRGVFHLAGTGEASWADFATEIFAASAALGGPSAGVSRITTADYATPARRPANSRLSTARLQQVHGVTMPHWTTSTRSVVERLVAATA
ncbi:dTDP-4-dehydrorhamnose reductase [Devosia oryziradicis]|uniref:dTDP-4-dehydrorhamnose reductase n=1 Tax=Devosia oryziradicis TaxID=2801335 RepID=A0ABX7BV63_9HYPH|nr:dTDP-4-dehydrorhamnose reductase [Devosia oryziradicis]QQR35443.1 dTDP-4-dehydrorhamnose reductase [Devosia oryziradicis]